jgi:hypothetical protein
MRILIGASPHSYKKVRRPEIRFSLLSAGEKAERGLNLRTLTWVTGLDSTTSAKESSSRPPVRSATEIATSPVFTRKNRHKPPEMRGRFIRRTGWKTCRLVRGPRAPLGVESRPCDCTWSGLHGCKRMPWSRLRSKVAVFSPETCPRRLASMATPHTRHESELKPL